jgi:hypothetical protein
MRTMMTLLAIATILMGCSDAGDTSVNPNGNVLATTDKTSYSVGESIAIALKNNSRSTVYFGHCNYRIGFWIERKDNDTWVDAGNIAILCQALYPSGRKDFPSSSISHDTISLTQTGTYRLHFPIAWLENQQIDDSILSNEFEIR